MSTEAVTIRIRKQLSDILDSIGSESYYTSKPEMILESMRKCLCAIKISINQFKNDPIEGTKVLMSLTLATHKAERDFASYSGDWVQIMVRVPTTMKKDIEVLCEKTGLFSDIRSFMKMSTVMIVADFNASAKYGAYSLSIEDLDEVKEALDEEMRYYVDREFPPGFGPGPRE